MTREGWIAELKTWVGTPYHHHARLKGVGADCVGLPLGAALNLGYIDEKKAKSIPLYPVQWHLHNREEKLLESLEAFGVEQIGKLHAVPGDLLTFKFGRTSSHVGILISETEFIHARVDFGGVVINSFTEEWSSRWATSWSIPEWIHG